MSIPNLRPLVEQLKAQYPAEWSAAHRGGPDTEAFVRRFAWEAFKVDPRFGLNGKRGNPADLSDDCVNFKGEQAGGDYDPTAPGTLVTVIDFIAGAPRPGTGDADGSPAWSYPLTPSAAAWVQPGPVVGGGTPPPVQPPPVASKPPYAGDGKFVDMSMILEADYREAGRPGLDGGCGVWFGRVDYDYYYNGLTMQASITKHRAEWRAALGLS